MYLADACPDGIRCMKILVVGDRVLIRESLRGVLSELKPAAGGPARAEDPRLGLGLATLARRTPPHYRSVECTWLSTTRQVSSAPPCQCPERPCLEQRLANAAHKSDAVVD